MKLVKSEHDNLFVNPASGIIYFVKRMDGLLLQFSTKIKAPDFLRATTYANKEMKRRLVTARRNHALLEQLFDEFIEQSGKQALRDDISQATVSKRTQAITKLKPFWGDKRVEEIDTATWDNFADYFEAAYPGETFFNTRKYMRVFCQWLFEKKLINSVPTLKNPFANRERKARKKKKSRIFTADEVSAILSACGWRERTIVLLMYTMAFRINEACALKWDSLDLSAGVYTFGEDDNKAKHEGSQAISCQLWDRLGSDYWSRQGPYVFCLASDSSRPIRPQMIDWQAIKQRSGVSWPWTPHTFRHTCLSLLFSNPKNSDAAIMKCFRISYKVALEHYIKIDDSVRETLRNAIEVPGVK